MCYLEIKSAIPWNLLSSSRILSTKMISCVLGMSNKLCVYSLVLETMNLKREHNIIASILIVLYSYLIQFVYCMSRNVHFHFFLFCSINMH